MADRNVSLWPEDIAVDVLTPLAILRSQASKLNEMTKGLLEGLIVTHPADGERELHEFDIVAPALGYYQHRILTATHHREMVYPVTIDAECIGPVRGESIFQGSGLSAATESEFVELVGKVFRSSEVKSVVHSLIARSNESRFPVPPLPPEQLVEPKKR